MGNKVILRCFELASGHRINLGKSTIIGIDLADDILKDLAEETGCDIGKLPFTYLGLPVGGNLRNKSFWSPIIKRVERRLAGWGQKYISLGGWVTLIKSVLMNLPIYYFSLFEIPKGVARRIEWLYRNFLWGDRYKKEVSLGRMVRYNKTKIDGWSRLNPSKVKKPSTVV